MNYRLEVDIDGSLICVTEYEHGMFTEWIVTSVINVDDILYFISR